MDKPKLDSAGRIYRGRFCISGVQWTGEGAGALATFTLTAEQLADVAESQLIWTDQAVQRGVNPVAGEGVPRELALADGYPDPKKYIFDSDKADVIAEKLLQGEQLFLNPLVWNLRPKLFSAYWSENEGSIYLYTGRVYLPDSHHRHQAILKAMRTVRDHKGVFARFSGGHQFKIELYFLDREGEGNYFYDKNQLPKPTAKSKAYDLTTKDDLSLLAKRVIEKSSCLSGGVNRVTDRLSAKSQYFITLSTLREMMKSFVGEDELEEMELEGHAKVAAGFFDLLSTIRPELRVVSLQDRKRMRESSLADAAVMMHGYAALMREFGNDIGKLGFTGAKKLWSRKLSRLSPNHRFKWGRWTGDVLSKRNPLWATYGVVKTSEEESSLTVLNTGGARAQAGKVLRALVAGKLKKGVRI